MKPQIIPAATRLGNLIESVLAVLRSGRAGARTRRLRIVPFRSMGTSASLTVRGRVIRETQTAVGMNKPKDALPFHAQLLSISHAFDVEEVAGLLLRISVAAVTVDTVTDRTGYFEAHLESEHGWSAGWHAPTITAIDTGRGVAELPSATTADVFVPDANARLMIVSDLDDTAMDTETLRSWRMLRTVLFRSASRRSAVPGVPELYRALQGEGTDSAGNPLCYISSGAWNLYDPVVEYLDTHALPRGAVFLNDWGSGARRFHAVAHRHKADHIIQLLERFPFLPFLLIGDDAQEDPELYAQLLPKAPGRIAAIWIRAVHPDPHRRAAVESLRPVIEAQGVEFIHAAATEAFASHAKARGWIR